MIYIADNWYQTYQDSIPGAYYDANNMGLIVIPASSVPFMQPFTFEIGGNLFTLDPEAQLLSMDQNTAWGAESGLQYGYIGPIGADSGAGREAREGILHGAGGVCGGEGDRYALQFIGSPKCAATLKKLTEKDTVMFADVLGWYESARLDIVHGDIVQ